MASGSSETPSKTYFSVELTPTSKKLLCIICGRKEENSSYRSKLFKNEKKAEVSILIEKYLEVEIHSNKYVDSVCRNCHRSVLTIQSKLCSLKQTYENTVSNLKKSHGRVSRKRLPFSEDVAETPKRTQSDGEILPALEQLSMDGKLQEKTSTDDTAINEIVDKIQKEITTFCSKNNNSILRSTNVEDLVNFSWTKVAEELQASTPIFWQLIKKCAENPRQKSLNIRKNEEANLSGIASVACKILSLHNREMNTVQRLNSITLLKGGAKKSAFRRLNATHDCMSYQSTLQMADDFGSGWEAKLMNWVHKVDEDTRLEKKYLNDIEHLELNAVFLDDPLDSVSNLFQIENVKTDLKHHRSSMHNGYYFVGDNVDMRTNVRQMTLKNQNKDQHMFQICAYENRISGNVLDNSKPMADIETVEFRSLVPSDDDKVKLTEELAYIMAIQWTDNMPQFQAYKTVLPTHITHKYIKETSMKTKRINVGVLKKNEQYNEEMTDICEFLNKYIPGAMEPNDERKPEKILSGGDYLTFERHKQAQSAKRNGRTPMKRMEGLVPKLEEFHNQAEFLQVIWKILYSTASSKDTGTLHAARNTINAKNVSKDPASNYYASSELIDKLTKANCVCAALSHFGMENPESAPKNHIYNGSIGSETEMRDYILSNARAVVEKFALLDFPDIPVTGYQSNTIICEICGHKYKHAKTLNKHKREIHQLNESIIEHTAATSNAEKEDHILNYSKNSLTLGLLKMNHDDAIRMGDGERILRLDKVFYLFYKTLGCTKYAYGILETLLQTQVLLSERDAHRLIWNRTVNNAGHRDTNLPNDLDLEHCNRVFKDEAHSFRGVFTEKVVSRVSRSSLQTDAVVKNFDRVSNVVRPSGKHTPGDIQCDIDALVRQMMGMQLFESIPGRQHSAFMGFKANQLSLNMHDFRDWLSRSMRKVAKKHFYTY